VKSIVVIPTYNERENIATMFERLHEVLPELHVLVVDDNSPDGTADVILAIMKNNERIHILQRPIKNGLGTAYCEGFTWAINQGFEIICQMDADFSHNPADLKRLIDNLDDADVVIGSRYFSGVNVINWPMSRLILSYSANLYTYVITRMPIKDSTGGFKAFKAEVLKKINLSKIKSNGYAFQIEMNFKAWRSGARIKEVSIVFVDRVNGESKMSKNIIFEAATLVWKLKIASLFGK